MAGPEKGRVADLPSGLSSFGSSMRNGWIVLLLKLIVTAATCAIVAYAVSVETLLRSLADVDWLWLALALLVFESAQLVSALRCVYVARALGGALSWSRSLRAHFIGLWFNQVLPTGLGGDLVKAALLRRDLGLGLAVRTTALDRVSGLALLMASIVVLLFAYQRLLGDVGLTVALGILAAGSLLSLGLLAALADPLRRRFARFPWIGHGLELLDNIKRFRRGRPLFEQVWTSSIVHVNGIVSFALIGRALGIELDILAYFLLVPLIFLIALIPVSMAGWGLREVGALSLFSLVGVPGEQAVALSVLFGMLLIVAGSPGLAMILLNPPRREYSDAA